MKSLQSLFLICTILLAGDLLPARQVCALASRVTTAVLQGDWQTVVQTLGQEKAPVADPVARLLMAHAALATNRNNLATVLFLSATTQEERNVWARYTDALWQRNPHTAIAFYLAADASARRNQLDEAIHKLTAGLKLLGAPTMEQAMLALITAPQPSRTAGLIYNALGVLYDLKGQDDMALGYFMLARQWAPSLAASHANYGQHFVLGEAAGKEVEEAFKRALVIDPTFALADNGLGCVYFGRGQFEEASRYFTRAMEASPALSTLAYANYNLALLYAAMQVTLATEGDKPGMGLETIQQLRKDPVGTFLDTLSRQISTLERQQEAYRQLTDALTSIPHIADPAQRRQTMQTLVKEQGAWKVLAAVQSFNQERIGELKQIQQGVSTLGKQISRDNKAIMGVFGLAQGSKLALASLGVIKAPDLMDKSLRGLVAINKRLMKATTPWYLHPFINGLDLEKGYKLMTPTTAIDLAETLSIGLLERHRGRAVGTALGQASWSQRLANDVAMLNKTLREVLPPPTSKAPSPLVTRLIPPTHPMADIARALPQHLPNLAGKTGLIVSNDPFRTELATWQMIHRGILPTAVPPPSRGTDINKYRAAFVLGLPTRAWDTQKVLPPPCPPPACGGGGGGGAALRPPDWSWATPFTPSISQPRPGGISTKEIGKAFTDRGGWPVVSAFSLVYTPRVFAAPQGSIQAQPAPGQGS